MIQQGVENKTEEERKNMRNCEIKYCINYGGGQLTEHPFLELTSNSKEF
jgi:hypothetical protein